MTVQRHHRPRLRMPALLAGVAILALVLAACGGGSGTARATNSTATSGSATVAPSPSAASSPSSTASPTTTASATASPPASTPTTAASPTPGEQPAYLDDRSGPAELVRSYYNAINRNEYNRAYSYWEQHTVIEELPPYPDFKKAFATTEHVGVTLGTITVGAAAGNRYYTVPTVLEATMTDGRTQTFAGCYILHLGLPANQAVPPFHPLAIMSATIDKETGSDPAAMAVKICGQEGHAGQPLAPTAAPGAGDIAADIYLDNRSTPVDVLNSYYNAINRKEYARAYGYWRMGTPEAQLAPFPQFAEGFSETKAVQLTTGPVTVNPGAGQRFYDVPVAVKATTTSGETQTFVGCYTLHLAVPAIQDKPPFEPMAIDSASIKQVANDADTTALMARACQR